MPFEQVISTAAVNLPDGLGLVLLCGVVMAIGLAGSVIPLLPGLSLCVAAVAVWAYFGDQGSRGAVVFGVCCVWWALGIVTKYFWSAAKAKRDGVANQTLVIGAIAGVIGAFVIPFVGLFIGFVAGVWLAETRRQGDPKLAWPATVIALKAIALSMAVELGTGFFIVGTWLTGVLLSYGG